MCLLRNGRLTFLKVPFCDSGNKLQWRRFLLRWRWQFSHVLKTVLDKANHMRIEADNVCWIFSMYEDNDKDRFRYFRKELRHISILWSNICCSQQVHRELSYHFSTILSVSSFRWPFCQRPEISISYLIDHISSALVSLSSICLNNFKMPNLLAFVWCGHTICFLKLNFLPKVDFSCAIVQWHRCIPSPQEVCVYMSL